MMIAAIGVGAFAFICLAAVVAVFIPEDDGRGGSDG